MIDKDGKRHCERCGVILTIGNNNICSNELCDNCNDILKNMLKASRRKKVRDKEWNQKNSMTTYLMEDVNLANMVKLFLLKMIICLSGVIVNHSTAKELRKLKIAHSRKEVMDNDSFRLYHMLYIKTYTNAR